MQLAVLIGVDQAVLAARRGRTPDALDGLHGALALAVEAGAPDLEAEAHAALQRVYRALGAFETALEHCDQRSAVLQRVADRDSADSGAVLRALDQATGLRPRWIADPFVIGYMA
jgi:hypothetical protein